MERVRWSTVALLFCLFLLAQGEPAGQALQELPLKHTYPVHEKELLEELQEVLEKLQHKKVSPWEKKFNQVPKCSFGDPCAIRKGARIGKLCDCPRRAACNAFLLKCL
ncbi:cocaine- and amphetamine-regulated transcript protein-like [Python bivittatus]|uniref:Cocaine- and amphetamine-regulated transcript protein-like n=1 Tax=Python bivittatus TaxID=176946 RepID=A0A9F5MT26_PYTBI|nr:cocaine- and amphetamine-regulated transcript protein-like [Python bivittatus]